MKKMYTLQVVAPREHSVVRAIQDLVQTKGWEEHIGNIYVPENKVLEVKNNKPKTVMKRMFPGYIFVEISDECDDAFVSIRRLRNVLSFIGSGKSGRPAAMSALEAKKIVDLYNKGQEEEVKAKHDFKVGHKVRVLNGPFTDYIGDIAEIDIQKDAIMVNVLIFGRPVPTKFSSKELDLEV